MYLPSNGSPFTANTWGYVAVHEKQEANRSATASHGELPRLPSREGRKKAKLKKEAKLERRADTRWERQIELLSRLLGVYDLITEDRECPSFPAETSAEVISAYERGRKAFVKDDCLVQLILVGNMDYSNVQLTAICTSAKSAGEKLLSVYEQSSDQRLDRLMEQLFS
ncbi:hypothetical protein AVEN_122268-1 [Araneus ventricosus]|uniref:Uncharacterized protein n=1 Tax=Araneus ventricosus TaxID=182803 RepID=A0A4Y2W199_ARAVE|nr:hypothetical protein AVEN_122268-1 [Araneus ventricosus]